jgi:5-methylcytosine-specific restriction enzyme subunit McrC
MSKVIRKYERELIEIGEVGFGVKEHAALMQWNQKNGFRFFEAGATALRCKQYVGVIQVGDLVIEILPKADRNADESDKGRWHGALLTMLEMVHGLRLYAADEADLALRRTNIMDIFLDQYVKEVRALVHGGLIKRYHEKRSNQTALKGRLDFPNHLRQNIVHRERFAVIHQTYDTDHLLHSILKKALDIVERTCTNAAITGRVKDMGWAFENVEERPISSTTFDRLRPNRKTAPYKAVLQLAKLIILNYNPDLQSGREPVLSILFDMERMWEKFMHRLLEKHCPVGWSVAGQEEECFWEDRTIRPDLVFTGQGGERIIADTKWKVPDNDRASVEDLRQMFAYNIRFVSARSVLIYPGLDRSMTGNYVNAKDGWFNTPHGCEVRFVMPFDQEGKVDVAAVGSLYKALTGVEAQLVK